MPAPVRLAPIKASRTSTPYERPAPKGTLPAAGPTPADLPPNGALALPPELIQSVLAHGGPWSSRDVRALSQSCRALNRWTSLAQPRAYAKAHQMTLAKAFHSGEFPLANRRAQSVLGALGALYLMDGDGPAAHSRLCDPSRTDRTRLTKVLRATQGAQAIHLGHATRGIAPWGHLLGAGLQASTLTTLTLTEALLTWAELEQFSQTFGRMPSLRQLELPSSVTCDPASYVKLLEQDSPEVCSLFFGPLTSLRKLRWKTCTAHGCIRVDLSRNSALRHLALHLGDRYGLGFEGWELGTCEKRNTLLLPPAPLVTLDVQGVLVSPKTAHHLNDAPWQNTLVELRLALQSACPFVGVDLRRYAALSRLFLEFYGHGVEGLYLPPPNRLTTLSLKGDATANLLQQLRTPTGAAVRRLLLDCRVEPTAAPNSIPWANLPNLTALTCSSWDDDPDRMQLSRLNIPQDNGLTRLRLEHTVFKSGFWAPEDAALQKLLMPQLQTLDLSGINSTWRGQEPIATLLQSFEKAVSQRARWPALREIVAADDPHRWALNLGLERLAARHKLQFTLISPYT